MSITIRSARATLLRGGLVAVFCLLVVAVVLVVWSFKSPLPKLDGSIQSKDITATVFIRRDERGTPHIEAQTEDDALYAEGYACAQDRLWQMDTLRRQAEGRLSEFAGPVALNKDRYMRTLGIGEAAERDTRALDARTRAALEAYAAGVNAAAASHPLPIEFTLLQYDWQPWSPKDTLAIAKLMAQHLDDQWYYLEVKALLAQKVGAAAAGALVDMQVPKLEHHIPGYDGARNAARPFDIALSRSEIAMLQTLPDWPRHEIGTGSNNWMVAGRRTSTGRPVLSNDTHLDHSLPSTWWIADLHGGGLHVAGFTLPGLPGIVVGHNERIAFGVTSAEEAVQDLYIEQFRSADSDEYLANGVWRKAQHRIERIGVKGQPDVVVDVLVTRHGPVIKREGTRALALAWTILRSGDEARALLGFDTAGNWQQFRAALSHFVGPVLNFGYADIDGHIGYQDAGRVPLRENGDGSLPVEGQDDRYAWHGYVPFDTLPHALDPPAGFVATANQELVAPSFRPLLSTYFEPPFRVDRIAKRLEGTRGASPTAIGAIQGDTFDAARLQLARATARVLTRSFDPSMRHLGSQLAAWDGMMSASARAPTFIMLEEKLLVRDLLEGRVGSGLLDKYIEHYSPIVPILRVLDGDRRLAVIGVTPATIEASIGRVAMSAAESLSAAGSQGLDDVQQWGEQNAAVYRHPLSAKWPLGFLSIPSVPQPGSGLAVYAGKPNHGPSERLVVDFADFDNSSMLLTVGESGVYSDPYYDDQVDAFVNVGWAPTPFSQAAVLAATRHTLVLEPRR